MNSSVQIRRSFGIFFINIAIAVASGSLLSEIAFKNNLPLYYYLLIWIGVFGAVFGLQFRRFKEIFSAIRQRMKNSTKWPSHIKAINGVCWALPFVLIIPYHEFAQYLILVGIGLGNTSTFIFMKRVSGFDNKEQLLVGLVALALILPAVLIDASIFPESQDIAVLLSRIFIAASYFVGGIYALLVARNRQDKNYGHQTTLDS